MENEFRRNYEVRISESAFEKYHQIQSDTLFNKVTQDMARIGEFPDMGRVYLPVAYLKDTDFEARECVCGTLYLYYRVVDEAKAVYVLDIRSQRQKPISHTELSSFNSEF